MGKGRRRGGGAGRVRDRAQEERARAAKAAAGEQTCFEALPREVLARVLCIVLDNTSPDDVPEAAAAIAATCRLFRDAVAEQWVWVGLARRVLGTDLPLAAPPHDNGVCARRLFLSMHAAKYRRDRLDHMRLKRSEVRERAAGAHDTMDVNAFHPHGQELGLCYAAAGPFPIQNGWAPDWSPHHQWKLPEEEEELLRERAPTPSIGDVLQLVGSDVVQVGGVHYGSNNDYGMMDVVVLRFRLVPTGERRDVRAYCVGGDPHLSHTPLPEVRWDLFTATALHAEDGDGWLEVLPDGAADAILVPLPSDAMRPMLLEALAGGSSAVTVEIARWRTTLVVVDVFAA